MKLTKREIDQLTCPSGRQDRLVFDDELTGFGMRISGSGAKQFLFQYRRGKAVHRVKLGHYGEITPAKARSLAEQCRGDVVAGRSPVAERAAVVAAEAEAMAERRKLDKADAFTLAVLIEAWETTGLKDASKAHRTEGPAALRRGLATFLKRPAHDITPAEAQRRIDAIAVKTPVMARRTRDYARAACNWAMARELLTANPFGRVAIEARRSGGGPGHCTGRKTCFLKAAAKDFVISAAGQIDKGFLVFFFKKELLCCCAAQVSGDMSRQPSA